MRGIINRFQEVARNLSPLERV